MNESDIQAEIMLDQGRGGSRIFRNHVAVGWTGKHVKTENGYTILQNARRAAFGLCVGSSDLVGFKRVLVTPEMVGQVVAVFSALEVKNSARKPEHQAQFLNIVRSFGGFAGFARSVDEARAITDPRIIASKP